MIPCRLELSNFLSYRDKVVLNFDGIQLACISGLNGAGKSSLLDAVTWTLFGKSRSRSDDDVVNRVAARNGETAEVRFAFALEDTVYQVIRQKKQGRTAVLEFQMQVGEEQWRAMSEGGVRETQAAIEKALRMNFDTFVNASFFLQGQADQFTTKTAGQRKEILADLLGVNLWDQYRQRAAERRKEEEERLLLLDARLNDIDAELAEEQARKDDLAAAQAEHDELNERLQSEEKLLEQMRRVEAAVKQQKQQVQDLRESLTRAEASLRRLEQTRAQRQEEREAYRALLDEAEAIGAAYAAWEEADEAFQCWQEKAEAYNRLQRQRQPHELTIERVRSTLQQRQRQLEKQREEVAAMQGEQKQLVARLHERRAALARLNEALQELEQKEEAWRAARSALQDMKGERQLWQREVARLQKQAQRVGQLQQEKETMHRSQAEAEAALEAVEARQAELAQQQERLVAARGDLDRLRDEQQRLRESMTKLNERLETLQDEAEGVCPLCGQALSEEHRQAVIAEVRTEGQAQGDRFRNNKERIASLTAEVEALQEALQDPGPLERERQAQQRRLARSQARVEEIERALREWEEEGQERLATLQEKLADDSAVKEKEAEVATLHEAVQERQAQDAMRQELQKEVAAAEARQAEIERALAAWETEGSAALAAVQEQLASGKVAPEAQAALAQLDEKIEALGYDEAAHDEARQARAALQDAPGRRQRLKEAQAAVRPLDATLADLEQQLAEQQETVATGRRQYETAAAQLAAMADGEGDLRAVEKAVLDLREKVVAANRKVGAAQQRLGVLDDLRRQRREERARRAEMTQLIQRLKLLEKACGRDGVQALLIEQALPEIEADANELLERLTGGDMRIMFDTQRELKSRDATVETLDIRISDGAGERPYENYSGGEQFRVNFAIRLALSRILARRAGARLQTLVIDEGFGSQDPAGRQRLVEAINTIREDFACILVITHIDELRDAFPMRIEVAKDATGSQITVV